MGAVERDLPPPTGPGSQVVVVAPSGPVDPGRLETGLALLRSWGLRVVEAPGLRGRHPRLAHLAGSDAARADALQAAWCDPRTAVVVAARGGAGVLRLLPRLDLDAMAGAGPRWLVGSSDLTALHAVLGARLGLVTAFAPMPATRVVAGPDPCPVTRAALRAAVTGAVPAPLNGGRVLVAGRAEGPVVGGTLALLAATLGTGLETRPPAGALLVVEDVGEAPYRLDRMLTQLRLAGHLGGLAGVAVGSLERCGDDSAVAAVLADHLGGLGVPVVTGLPFGHGRPQGVVWLGATAVLDASAGPGGPGGLAVAAGRWGRPPRDSERASTP